jgi:sterol desaturase/sphingolipid hydroxylase (fatty acid hydroxylase superfamily)
MELLANLLDGLRGTFAAKFFLSPVYIGSTVLIVWAIWVARGKPTGLLRFMFPKELYLHPSTMVDFKIALFNTVFIATGALSLLWIGPTVTLWLTEHFALMTGGPLDIPETGLWQGVLAATLLFLTQDFCRYWNHYLHHMIRVLWPFHAVHHSAEVLTPVTFLRAHPTYYALQTLLMSVLTGFVQAVILFALVGQIESWVIYAGTVAFNAYVFFAGHLRHSHIWLSYGPKLEHILISPAQHQVHHSSDPIHHDKNFGEVFAFWDWMFGTLYVPDGPEELTFGIAGRDGVRIEQPYPTLKDALIGPFIEVWEEIAKGTSLDPDQESKTP